MKSFLSIVAQDILAKYGSNLSEIAVVFPNKRASLFLNEELIKQSDGRPVWSPQYMTISELFRSQTELVVADQIKLVCELYRHYTEQTGSLESLDDFYGWGELMLSDFDDLDKNMGDAEHIFENTGELHSYDNADYLTDEQKKALKRFFANFKEETFGVKKNFEELWNHLGDIYTSFRESLRSQGIAYEGMLYRDVVEKGNVSGSAKKYLFIGFNLLQRVEQELMSSLLREDKAAFYWDYDNYYMSDANEAGKYIKSYLSSFPNEISTESGEFDNIINKPEITFISAQTEDIQARYVSNWLTPERLAAGKRTAIVLCDETLLPTVIHSLPESVKDVNITTGYPLSQTLVSTLVKHIFTLKLHGSSRVKGTMRLHQVNMVLRHPYMKYISENAGPLLEELNKNHIFYPTIKELSKDDYLASIFLPLQSHDESKTPDEAQRLRSLDVVNCLMHTIQRIATQSNHEDSLMQESLYRMHQIMNRISTLIQSGELVVSDSSLQSIISQIIRSTTIPFHGEPIIGLQIMGVLETRNLDFDHMLILSANEGNIPKSVNDSSFIPHVIRHAYGLTTIENKVAIYAYYFHRMMQRTGDVTITYNNSTNDTKTNEMSRFMMQLIAESPLKINVEAMTSPLVVSKSERCDITKTPEVIEKMNKIWKVSPSAINSYLRCQLQYFYKYVCGIQDVDDTDEDEIDNRVFGLIFHKAAEMLYSDYKRTGRQITKSDIEAIRKDPSRIERAIEEGFREELFQQKDAESKKRKFPELNGVQLINKKIITKMIDKLLEYDERNTPFEIVDLEYEINDSVTFNTDNGRKTLKVNGIIDRLDIVNDKENGRQMRIVDYKTGTKAAGNLKDIGDLFTKEGVDSSVHTDYYLQTLLYARIISMPENGQPQNQGLPVVPALLYPHHVFGDDYDPVLTLAKEKIRDIRDIADEYNKGLASILSEIFDYSHPFTATDNDHHCETCFYANICGKLK